MPLCASPSSPPSSPPHIQTGGFDRIPDHIVLIIFNRISDLKSLARCRAVAKRFNSLVPQAETLVLRVDSVISSESKGSFLSHLLRSILHSLHHIVSPKPPSSRPRYRNSPSEILHHFENVRNLEIELPAGDLRLEKGTVLKWKAKFGRSLKCCVILGIREIAEASETDDGGEADEIDFYGERGGLKLRVVWTISALIAASARHYLLNDVIREHEEMEGLVLRDRDGEGVVVMDKEGLREFREVEDKESQVRVGEVKSRTMVPAVRMRMRHVAGIDLPGGVRMRGATLVVVWAEGEREEEMEGFVAGAFGGVFGDLVQALVKRRSYVLEMNSF
ncbi:F-box protein AUF1-like [Magnolia sinica]|uniref:F-box protein AUF1-like n=1 Tax=Magnolia sinica TaxID=86752 RepID=UPI00265AFA35|nr:F-box protein AUF1-like [Magnolia sinica]